MRMGVSSIHAVGGPRRIVLWDCWPSPVVGLEVDSCQRAHHLPLHVDQGIVNYWCNWTTTNCKTVFFYIPVYIEKMQRYTVYYIWKLLYIFRVVSPPIIRSAYNCIYSIWYLSHTVTATCR
jgi:hypothetical protein